MVVSTNVPAVRKMSGARDLNHFLLRKKNEKEPECVEEEDRKGT